MKTSILTLLVVLITLTSKGQAQDICANTLSNHIDLVERSEVYLDNLGDHAADIKPFDITLIQRNLTERNQSLKALQALYDNEGSCQPKILADAVAIYDYSRLGDSIIAKPQMRRIVLDIAKYKPYKLTDLVKNFKKFTKNKFVEKTIAEIEDDKVILPEGLKVEKVDANMNSHFHAISDVGIKAATGTIAGAARVWGFISDKLKWRKGHLRKNMEARALMKSNLRPLDLVYETRKFTLSNLTIPGYWGHVGVWLGTKEELIELGVWDQPYFKTFRAHVEAGQNIVEIRKQGVNFQSIETFINLDEIAITRVKGINERVESVFEELNNQIAKKYDFKFDARSADKITCAELIGFSYGDIKWSQKKTLFQYSLRPDDLAVLSLDTSTPMEFIIYLKGKKDGSYDNMSFEGWKKLFNVKESKQDENNSVETSLAGA